MTKETQGTIVEEVVEKMDQEIDSSSVAPAEEKETLNDGEDVSKKEQEVSDEVESESGSDELDKEEAGVKRDIEKQEKRIAELRKKVKEKRAERRESEKEVESVEEDSPTEEEQLLTGPAEKLRAELKGELLMEMHEESIVGDFLRGSPAIYGDEKNVSLLKEYVHDRFKFSTAPNKAELKSAYDMAHSYLFGELEVLRAREEGKSEAYKQMATAESANTPTGIKSKEREGAEVSSEDKRIAKKVGIKPETYSRYKDYYGKL